MPTTETTQLLGQAEVTQLLENTPFWALDIRATSPPEERCLLGRALTAEAGEGAILCPWFLRDHSAQVSSQTVEGEQADCRSNTASGTDPFSGSRQPGTFPTRGEVSAGRALTTRAGERAIWCPVSLGDKSVQVSVQTAEATHLQIGRASCRERV